MSRKHVLGRVARCRVSLQKTLRASCWAFFLQSGLSLGADEHKVDNKPSPSTDKAEESADRAKTPVWIIRGKKRRGKVRLRRPGVSRTWTPSTASEVMQANRMDDVSSFVQKKQGKPSATGFQVPRIRGQDSRLSEIYIDRWKVQDPLTGLPVIENLDVRAFGRLQQHVGTLPYDIPSAGGLGALVFRSRPVLKKTLQLGLDYGPVYYGTSLWTLMQRADRPSSARLQSHLYARIQNSDGSFVYYDNARTPTYLEDDVTRALQNNDQKSWQILQRHTLQMSGKLQLYGLQRLARQWGGLRSPGVEGSARQQAWSYLGLLGANFRWHARSEFRAYLGWQIDERIINDPQQQFVSSGRFQQQDVNTRRTGLEWRYSVGDYRSSLSLEGASAEVQLGHLESATYNRHTSTVHWGQMLDFRGLGQVEWKNAYRLLEDSGDGSSLNKQRRWDQSLALRVPVGERFWSYVQWSAFTRSPSLLEKYGDGGVRKASVDLKPEQIEHLELGWQFGEAESGASFGLQLYWDRVKDKILFISTSLNAIKALNFQKTDSRGVELQAQTPWWFKRIRFSGHAHYQDARQVGGFELQLPGLPAYSADARASLRMIPSLTLTWQHSFQSEAFLDASNTILWPERWVQHLQVAFEPAQSASIQHDSWLRRLSALLEVRNLTHVRYLDAEFAQSGSNQDLYRVAFSDISGYPLPGRSFWLHLAWKVF